MRMAKIEQVFAFFRRCSLSASSVNHPDVDFLSGWEGILALVADIECPLQLWKDEAVDRKKGWLGWRPNHSPLAETKDPQCPQDVVTTRAQHAGHSLPT